MLETVFLSRSGLLISMGAGLEPVVQIESRITQEPSTEVWNTRCTLFSGVILTTVSKG
jgi:hypothetical protein